MPGLAVPKHRQHILLLALALPHQKVPALCQQLSHLRPWDGPVVPQLLMKGLLHLRNELQRWGKLGRSRGGVRGVTQPAGQGRPLNQLGVNGVSVSHAPQSLHTSQEAGTALHRPPELAVENGPGSLQAELGWKPGQAGPTPGHSPSTTPRAGRAMGSLRLQVPSAHVVAEGGDVGVAGSEDTCAWTPNKSSLGRAFSLRGQPRD